ncbi:hypothetical protein N0V83_001395 [Neocucurbitaria cava]|uniref:Uncharacterized protein n=1 Tax=Neocucurbitaria cava TaxID=798079 RepID=A0A9W8YG04_9PLEO|nr:hypothetical protein N0V83_001395 [Neocucurbitaria cava]
MPIMRKTTILDLPVEIIHTIRDFAAVASRACLALNCHHLLHYIGTRVFTDLDYNNTRLEKAAFLQTLQKDRLDPKLWLCYGCLRFHPVTQRYDPPNFGAVRGKEGVGFPKSVVVVRVWQHVGRLAYPFDQNESGEGHKSLYSDVAAPQESVVQKQMKLLPVLVDFRSKWRTISLSRGPIMRAVWRSRLKRMQKSKSEAAMVPMLAPAQQRQSLGEMKRRWESLAMLEATTLEEECKQYDV